MFVCLLVGAFGSIIKPNYLDSNVLNVKVLVGNVNKEKGPVGAFSVIVKTLRALLLTQLTIPDWRLYCCVSCLQSPSEECEN